MAADEDERVLLNAWLEAEVALKREPISASLADENRQRVDALTQARDAAKLTHDTHIRVKAESGRSAAHLYRLHSLEQPWARIDEPCGIRELGVKALIAVADNACGHCQGYRDVYFSWTFAPKLPLLGCTAPGGCRCSFTA
jgi:hypothetical protein